jgi:hypothetical protein
MAIEKSIIFMFLHVTVRANFIQYYNDRQNF